MRTKTKTQAEEQAKNKVIMNRLMKFNRRMDKETKKIMAESAKKADTILATLKTIKKHGTAWYLHRVLTKVSLALLRYDHEINELQRKDAEKEKIIQELQKRVTALENAQNGGSASSNPEVKKTGSS
jgi:hypothetical protein